MIIKIKIDHDIIYIHGSSIIIVQCCIKIRLCKQWTYLNRDIYTRANKSVERWGTKQ